MEARDLFDDDEFLLQLWEAYRDARKNKRSALATIAFDQHVEHNIHQLYREIIEGRYQLSPSICFVVDKPVKREIFAADFRDRVVHHYVINRLLRVFENQFIYDSYSCRKGKGTLFGIKRLQHAMRACTENYTKEAYVLKMDLSGFFMSINRQLLCDRVCDMVGRKYHEADLERLLGLIRIIVMHDPTTNCCVRGGRGRWEGLPANKSLFKSQPGCGIPIGNLTSQIFANFYLSDFDRYVKETLKMRYYGRYVDDFYIVHRDKQVLKHLVPKIRDYLACTVHVKLHPHKVYLQPCDKGIAYLGAEIHPWAIYPTRRVFANYENMIGRMSASDLAFMHSDAQERLTYSVNSYTGMCHHYDIYQYVRQTECLYPTEYLQMFPML